MWELGACLGKDTWACVVTAPGSGLLGKSCGRWRHMGWHCAGSLVQSANRPPEGRGAVWGLSEPVLTSEKVSDT